MAHALKHCVLFSCILLIVVSCERSGRDAVPSGRIFNVLRVQEPPAVDGILNDECWHRAEASSLVLCADGANPDYPTTVRILYDDSMLYVGFECRDLDAAGTVSERDGPVDREEHVTLCIDADADTLTYAVVSFSPTGVVWDAFVMEQKGGATKKILSDWNCEGLRSSVSVYGGGPKPGTEDRFWTVEIALPLSELYTAPRIPPADGDAWRFNSFRLEMTGGREYSALSPTGSVDGYNSEAFAWLLFGG